MISKPKKSENKVQPQNIERRLLTMARAGQIIGYSTVYVNELCRKGLLPCVRLGRKRLIDSRDLEQLIERSKETGWTVRPQDRRPHLKGIGRHKVVPAACA